MYCSIDGIGRTEKHISHFIALASLSYVHAVQLHLDKITGLGAGALDGASAGAAEGIGACALKVKGAITTLLSGLVLYITGLFCSSCCGKICAGGRYSTRGNRLSSQIVVQNCCISVDTELS